MFRDLVRRTVVARGAMADDEGLVWVYCTQPRASTDVGRAMGRRLACPSEMAVDS